MAEPLLVHIGYHKTATTWFQHALFPQHEPFATPVEYKQLTKALVWPQPLNFNAEEARAALEPALQTAWDAGRTPVLSAERLSGNPTSGGFDSKEIAQRIAATFPQARVWMAIREQRAMVGSYYKQYVQEGGTASMRRMLRGDGVLKRIPQFRLEHFQYLPLIRHYQELLGDEQVLVSLYEEFKADPTQVIQTACDFAGVPAPAGEIPTSSRRNVSYSDRSTRILRATNGLFAHPYVDQRPAFRLPGRRVPRLALQGLDKLWGKKAGGNRLQKQAHQLVGTHYAQSNRQLATHLDKDLASWGYAIA